MFPNPMDEWSKDFLVMLETAANEVEQFFLEVTQDVTVIVETLWQASEEFTEELHQNIFPELDLRLQELIEPLFDDDPGSEEPIDNLPQIVTYLEPTPQKHPACIGCQHYHGQVYGGNLLVCGMHPYGWETNNCPDWEADDFHTNYPD